MREKRFTFVLAVDHRTCQTWIPQNSHTTASQTPALLPHDQASNEEALIVYTCPYKGGGSYRYPMTGSPPPLVDPGEILAPGRPKPPLPPLSEVEKGLGEEGGGSVLVSSPREEQSVHRRWSLDADLRYLVELALLGKWKISNSAKTQPENPPVVTSRAAGRLSLT
ncbi:hypothetical protein INR49_020090 [Caranx melampygus]|nr:hypothetical protein INR49_020090 [Caranx melampygus]